MAVAAKIGVSHMTLRRQADIDPEFCEAEKEMYLQWEHRIEWAQVKAACGQLKVSPGMVYNSTAAWGMLKHLNPARYGDTPIGEAMSTLANLIKATGDCG